MQENNKTEVAEDMILGDKELEQISAGIVITDTMAGITKLPDDRDGTGIVITDTMAG